MVIGCMLFFCTIVMVSAQLKVVAEKDSVVYDTFSAWTNDWLYWNGEIYNYSDTPLNVFQGYDSLYRPWFILCESSGTVRMDKDYMAIWSIMDDRLYLCDMVIVCNDDTYPRFEDYSSGFMRGLTFDDLFLIRLNPLEELTDRRFKKQFPAGIYKRPLGSGYAISADWFNGTIDIKRESSDYFASYRRLIFKNGRIVSIQNLIYCDYLWDSVKQKMVRKLYSF